MTTAILQGFFWPPARTNREGVEQFRHTAEEHGFEAFSVEVGGMLHLKTGVSGLDHDTVLALPTLSRTFEGLGYRVIVVDPQDWHAANVLTVGRRVLLPAGHPRVVRSLLESRYEPLEVELSEFAKQDGGASCLSILLP